MLETVNELLNDVTDEKFLKDAVDKGLFLVCKDVILMYISYFDYYKSISSSIYLPEVNEFNIN
jgi:hypothetical protein